LRNFHRKDDYKQIHGHLICIKPPEVLSKSSVSICGFSSTEQKMIVLIFLSCLTLAASRPEAGYSYNSPSIQKSLEYSYYIPPQTQYVGYSHYNQPQVQNAGYQYNSPPQVQNAGYQYNSPPQVPNAGYQYNSPPQGQNVNLGRFVTGSDKSELIYFCSWVAMDF